MTTAIHSHQLDSLSQGLTPRQEGEDTGDWLLSNTTHVFRKKNPISVHSSAATQDGNIDYLMD